MCASRVASVLVLAGRRAQCLFLGHMWDSERPGGPLGYEPDRCWRCDRTRPDNARKKLHACRSCRKALKP